MAVGYVNGSMASDVTTDGGSAVITLGWTPSAGELLVVVMKGQYSATLPTWGLTAFTALSRQSTGTSGVGQGLTATQVWYKTADGTETSLTCTQSTAGNTTTHFQPHAFGFSGVPAVANIQHEQEIVLAAAAGVNVVPASSTATGSGLALFMRARVNGRGTGNAMASGGAGFTQRSIGTWGSQYPSSMLATKSVTSGTVTWPESTNVFVDDWLLEKVVLYDNAAMIGGIYVDGAVHF